MFHKPHRTKSNTQLKGSEKKKFVAEISNFFPSLTPNDLSRLFPSKADVTVTKIFCTKGEIVNVFQIQKEPMFFKLDRENEIYPTVYFLWQYPTLIKSFTTHDPVMPKLMQGADLMLPGIEIKGELTINAYGKFEKGKMVAINSVENACPFAIGKTALSSMDMYMSARQGKGVVVLHIYKDFLWEMGTKAPLPILSYTDINKDSRDESVDSNLENISDRLQNSSLLKEADDTTIGQVNTDSPALSETKGMDQLFLHCFLKAWKTTAKKAELPILTSNFYRLHMVPACPDRQSLDIKKSSYKKLSKFLNAMSKKGIVQVKEYPKGVENITAFNFAHEDFKNFEVDENETSLLPESNASVSANIFTPPTLEEVYQVSGTTVQFFKRNGLGKGDVLSRADIRSIITTYIDRNNLKRNETVELDTLLHEAIVNPKEGYKEFLRWDEIFSRFLGKMAPAFRICRPGQVPIIRKGKLESIELAVAKRSGNKKVTLIYNVGIFGIDENEFAHQIQVGVATSTSVGPAENKPQGVTQILVQGNQVLFVGRLLLDTYKIPRKYIRGLELAQKGKK